MGAFYLIDEPNVPTADRLRGQVEGAFALQGFGAPVRLTFGHRHLGLYQKLCGAPLQLHRHGGGGFAALCGSALIEGERGPAAARALGRSFGDINSAADPDWTDWIGQYVALHADESSLSLFLDPLGIYKVYRRNDGRVFASSFLAVAATVEAPRLNHQAVYEYLFQEATYGGDTVLEQVELARHGGIYRFAVSSMQPATFDRWQPALPDATREAPIEEHVDACLSRLRFMFRRIADGFGDDVDTALSGGYDSRLIVALLIEQGLDPNIHVYGRADAADVMVARQVASAEGLQLEHVDKSEFDRVAPDDFAAVVEHNFLAFDGYPPAGILDGGVDRATRLERSADARLMLNGGGGEVFRNFFYLPGGRFSCRDIVHTFYSRYDPACTTDAFHEQRYVARLSDKIRATLGARAETLSRVQVERVYPEFRCCYWMGRNNAINNRFGFALTPFVDPTLLPYTVQVPLRYKNHGRLEARMIATVSPSLAGHSSDYGHPFDRQPPLKRVVKDYATFLRPPWLRRLTYRLRHRHDVPASGYLQAHYLAKVIDPALPVMSMFLRLPGVNDPMLRQRACTLEYFCQRLGI